MKIYKSISVFVFSIIAINTFIYFVIINYIQESVNNHTTNADYCTIALLFLALFLCFISLLLFLRKKRNESVYFLFLFGINIILWLPKIFSIQCKGCSMA
ncbi:hypothetical protein FLGE108171_11815 [Flavobacterium gelidilacus]